MAVESSAKSYLKRKANKHLTEDAAKSISKSADSVFDEIEAGSFGTGGITYFGTIAFGTTLRVKHGEGLFSAIGNEMVEDAMFAIAPELAIGGLIGSAAVDMYPQINKMAEQKKSMKMNYNYLGGDYIDTQSNYTSRARAMQHIKRARASMAAGVGGEARRYHR